MASETYWQCKVCGQVEVHDAKGYRVVGVGHVADLEPVAVLPLVEADALKRLLAAVEDDELKESVGDKHWDDDPVDVLDYYRRALLAAMKGGGP